MFVTLFFVTFLLALAVSAIVAWISKEAIESVLNRYFAAHISAAMSKYLRFAVVVVGVAMGTRVQALEDYVSAPSWTKANMDSALTPAVWAMELYRTAMGALAGILWLSLVFAFLVAVGLFFIRRANLRQVLSSDK
jgi:hypothetical protein